MNTYFVSNKHSHYFVVETNRVLDREKMKDCTFYNTYEELLNFAESICGEPVNELIESEILLKEKDSKLTETDMRGIEIEIPSEEGPIEKIISEYIL